MCVSSKFARLAAFVLVLVMVLGVSVPTTVVAKEFKEIDLEGDPGDGDEVDGAGGGGDGFEIPPQTNGDVRWGDVLGYRLFVVVNNGVPAVYVVKVEPENPR